MSQSRLKDIFLHFQTSEETLDCRGCYFRGHFDNFSLPVCLSYLLWKCRSTRLRSNDLVQPESVYFLLLKKQQKNHWISFVFFYDQIISEHYVWLQSSILLRIKEIVKKVIYWDQAEWFCSICSELRALSM